MESEQCPICCSELEVKVLTPCDDCGSLEEEISHFKEGKHTYSTYEIYEGLKLQLCNFCDVDFGSYQSEYFGFKSDKRISFENLKFISSVVNPTLQKGKYCTECNKGLKFLLFLKSLREINENA